jgi:hypothetical protein
MLDFYKENNISIEILINYIPNIRFLVLETCKLTLDEFDNLLTKNEILYILRQPIKWQEKCSNYLQ